MNIQFQKAKNGELTAVADSVFLHSSYNPTKEAERFIQNFNLPFSTKLIIITEPALSYIVPLLKNKFKCQVGIIRYVKDFQTFNNGDFVINFYEHSKNFDEFLFSFLGEEKLLTTFFMNYETSSKVFHNENEIVWKNIKSACEKAKTVLVTRQFFEKKWFLNSVYFLNNVKNLTKINDKTDKTVIICASGPSLKSVIPVIKENQDKLFIICLSSAISVLNKNGIKPDLYFSTDGGFWAGEHLKHLDKNIPLAVSLESHFKKSSLSVQRILPLYYDDGLSYKLYQYCNLDFFRAERNGTVSGTALKFAENISRNNIYFTGLDMHSGKGFQHTQPNEIELNNCLKDSRIKNSSTRLISGEFSSGSMKIYENWFQTQKFSNNIYRIIENPQNKLGNIKDISTTTFIKNIKNLKSKKENIFSDTILQKNISSKIKDFILLNYESEEWKKSLFPLDYVSLQHDPENKDLVEKINKENKKLISKIWKELNE